MDLENFVKTYIEDEVMKGSDQTNIGLDDPLVDSGIIDSLALLNLIMHLEHSGFSIDPNEIIPENFQTVNKICALLRQKE